MVLTVQFMNETRIGSLGKVKVFSNIVIDNGKLKREPPGFKQHSFSKRAKATKTWILAWETRERGSRMHNLVPRALFTDFGGVIPPPRPKPGKAPWRRGCRTNNDHLQHF